MDFMIKKILYSIQYEYVTKIKKRDAYDEAGIRKLAEEALFEEIRTALNERKPFCIGKIGGSEAFAMSSMYFGRKKKEAYSQLCAWSGFFPNMYDPLAFKDYYKEQTEAIAALDIILNFPKKYEMLFLKKYATHDLKWCRCLTPWMQKTSVWISLLKGKKVLVIHPFVKTIEKQYQRREKIFDDSNMLPEFELHTLEAVQTIGSCTDERFTSWKEALDYMTEQVRVIDFDVALIGCGAYGLPLAARIKKMGKIGIHCGGELQTYFGIRGKRWDEGFPEEMSRVCNEYWVYPDEQERVEGAEEIEGGCYW